MRAVLKFGGSILRRGQDYLKMVDEVRKFLDKGWEVVVVVSAIKGVTDILEQLAKPCDRWREYVLQLRELHEKVLHEVGLPSSLEKEVMTKLNALFSELYRIVEAINVLNETSTRVRDYVLSFGERLSVLIAWAAFMRSGIEAVHLTGREAGIITDDRFGEASPIYDLSKKYVPEILGKYLRAKIVPIVTGFIAGTPDGKITTFGRGGSDFTATLLGALLESDIVVLYTDVPGIMTGDPRYVKNPRVVPKLSYDEAIACAKLGAKRLHPRTFEPVRKTNVRTIITAIGALEKTEILREAQDPPIKLVTLLERNELIKAQVSERKLTDVLVELSLGLSKLGVEEIPVLRYSELEQCLLLVVKEELLGRVLQVLKDLQNRQLIRDVRYVHYVSLVSLIGHGVSDLSNLGPFMSRLTGIDAHTILMFDSAISIAVPSDRSVEALCKLHDELIKQWETFQS